MSVLVKFSHRNLPDRVKELTGRHFRVNEMGMVYLDNKEIALYYRGFNGQYWRVWNDETFYEVYSDMEITSYETH